MTDDILMPAPADLDLTVLLAREFGPLGFEPSPLRSYVRAAAWAGMVSVTHGIIVEIDDDCARLVLPDRPGHPGYRLLIPRHTGLTSEQLIGIAGRHVRMILNDRQEE